VSNLVKAGFANLKSVISTKQQDNKEKSAKTDTKRKSSSESIGSTPETPSVDDPVKAKSKKAAKTTEQEKKSQPYGRLWQASSRDEGRR